jgi:hypothetical protein
MDLSHLPNNHMKTKDAWASRAFSSRSLNQKNIHNIHAIKLYYLNWEKNLSPTEKKAFLHYSTTESAPINQLLRNQTQMRDMDIYRYCELVNKAASISAAIKENPLPFDVNVYRGLKRTFIFKEESINPQDLIGKEIMEDGFISTSLSKEKASLFGNLLLEISLKKGDKAAYISGVAARHSEEEVLIDKGQTLMVQGFRKVGERIILQCHIKT